MGCCTACASFPWGAGCDGGALGWACCESGLGAAGVAAGAFEPKLGTAKVGADLNDGTGLGAGAFVLVLMPIAARSALRKSASRAASSMSGVMTWFVWADTPRHVSNNNSVIVFTVYWR